MNIVHWITKFKNAKEQLKMENKAMYHPVRLQALAIIEQQACTVYTVHDAWCSKQRLRAGERATWERASCGRATYKQATGERATG